MIGYINTSVMTLTLFSSATLQDFRKMTPMEMPIKMEENLFFSEQQYQLEAESGFTDRAGIFKIYKQQRLGSVCTCVQSDQSFCCFLTSNTTPSTIFIRL